ncbi:MAG: Dna2/Cas4 domain-containing protein [Thermosphaera sp.]
MVAIKYVVSASELAKLAFCEKMFFIERYYKAVDFRAALRLMRGRILHSLWRAIKKGLKEKLLATVIDDVLLIGKPDCFHFSESGVIVEEFKSRRLKKVYLSEAIQLIAYMKLIKDNYNQSVKGYINYLNAKVEVRYSEAALVHFIERYKQIVERKDTPRSKCKLKQCRYSALCASLFN